MACTFPIEREMAVWPPPAPLRELLLDADPDERRIADHLAHGELYVAKNCGTAAGVIVIRQTREHTWEIMNCSVAPEYRRQHCGTALVRHALDIIRNKGGRYAEVGTSDASPGPMALYEAADSRFLALSTTTSRTTIRNPSGTMACNALT